MKVEKPESGVQVSILGAMEALTVFEQISNILKDKLKDDWCGGAVQNEGRVREWKTWYWKDYLGTCRTAWDGRQ